MELTLDQALQKGIEAHKAGKVQEADAYYTSILKANPKHPDANHNMGVLAVGVGKVEEALPFLKTALEVNPNITQFWLSYINALIKLDQMDQAKAALEKARQAGAKGESLDQIEQRIGSPSSRNSNEQDLSQNQIQHLINLYNQGQLRKVFEQTKTLTERHHNSLVLWNLMGATAAQLGKLGQAVEAFNKVLIIDPNWAETHKNLGNVLIRQGKLDEAIEAYNKALAIKPDYAEAYWNLSGTAESIGEAKKYLEKCLKVSPNHLKAKLTLSALKFYEGDKSEFNELIKSDLRDHSFIRSFNWVFNLPKIPTLHFHRWALFDHMTALSKRDRPFYEFGVWRGEAFRYLINTFKN